MVDNKVSLVKVNDCFNAISKDIINLNPFETMILIGLIRISNDAVINEARYDILQDMDMTFNRGVT